jgi:acetyltransferase-like isoleucine patch superfamily enzyme
VILLKIISFFFPWPLRRRFLNKFFSYKIHADARIGLAWIFPRELILAAESKIDHFNVAIHLNKIELGPKATISRGNWITGFPVKTDSSHFKHQSDRKAELILGESSSITKNHHFDCTSQIHIGRFTTIAGYESQFLTHSIDMNENRQDSDSILIGDYSFIGTNVVVLGGTTLPSHSILGAKSLLNKRFSEEWCIYGGVPAKKIGEVPRTAKYFTREVGYVY